MRATYQFVRSVLLIGLLCGAVLADEDSDFEDDVTNEDFDDIPPVHSQDLDGDTVEPLKPLERPEYKKPVASGSVYFTETFDSEAEYKSRWIQSRAKKDNTDDTIAKYDGQWSIEEPKEIALKGDLGLVLKSKAKHHAISAKLDKTIDFTTKSMVFQYEVKFQNGQECGGAYIKLLTADSSLDLTKFFDKTPYTIMFGPDKCGNDYKLHFIFRHKNPLTGAFEEKHAKKPTATLDKYFTDKKSHLYTLVLHNDNSFEIYVDQDLVNSGSLLQDMQPPVNPPKEISDPDDKKPSDWDDRERIPDPDAVKPDDWDETEPEMMADSSAVKPDGWLDDEPELVPDSNSEKPQDWDDDMDGEWEPPMINNPKCESAPGCGSWEPPKIKNPKYKGKWSAPMIDNPGYKGKWSPKMIPNPDFFEDKEPYKMTPIGALGLELWSMSDDILFDNFIFTNDKKVADDWADQSWVIKHEQELAGTSSGSGVFDAIMDATRERPWLWIVFAVVIVLPVFMLIVYCCCMPPKKDEVGARKKSDKPTADDAAANDDFEEDEPQPEPEEAAPQDDTPATRSSKRSPTSKTATQRKGKSSLNADVSSTSRESGDK